MNDQMKAALEKTMNDFDQKRSAAAKRQEAADAKHTEFSRALERCFKEVIRPEMEEVKSTLAKGKHECTISEQKRTATTDLREQPDHIKLEIKPAPPPSGGHVTMITRTIYFAAVPQEGKIVIGTTSSIPEHQKEGMRGYEPSRLTRDEVGKQLVAFVKEVLT
jgi:hypothetical protein